MQRPSLALLLCLSPFLTACGGPQDHSAELAAQDQRIKVQGVKAESAFPTSSKDLSTWVRSNTANFWEVMRAHAPAELNPYIGFNGIVTGDAHISNFAPVPARENGVTSLRFMNVDFDDGGRAPLVLDFLRLVVITKATKDKVKVSALTNAYVAGLRGEKMEYPAEIAKLMKLSLEEYKKQADDYIGKKTKKDGMLKRKEGKQETYTGAISREQLAALLPADLTIQDVTFRPHDHGSSAELTRLYILAKDGAGHSRLFELKERGLPAVAKYAAQPETKAWYQELVAALWGEAEGYDKLVEIPGEGTFWLREKRVKLIDVPYASDSKSSVKFVQDFSAYDAYILGRLHGRQPDGKNLASQIGSNQASRTLFKDSVKAAAQSYLRVAVALAAAGGKIEDPDSEPEGE